jgi:hypothetical protein
VSINRGFSCLELSVVCSVQKYTFSLTKNKVSVENWHKWHYILQHLFCVLFCIITENAKKRAVPLLTHCNKLECLPMPRLIFAGKARSLPLEWRLALLAGGSEWQWQTL